MRMNTRMSTVILCESAQVNQTRIMQ
jgi:hypothetical protein